MIVSFFVDQLYYVTFVLLSCSTFPICILYHVFIRFCVFFVVLLLGSMFTIEHVVILSV